MRVHPFKIPRTKDSSIELQEDVAPHFYDVLHQHAEIQLTLVTESTGTLFIGDNAGGFKPGDLFIIGSNVPHVFKNDKTYFAQAGKNCKIAKSVSVFFEEHSLGKDFLDLPETTGIKGLFSKTAQGLQFSGPTSEKVYPLIQKMFSSDNIDRLINFISILKILSNECHYQTLTAARGNYAVDTNEAKRLNDIFRFTLEHFRREITIQEISDLAHMTPTSFCRYFKKRTRKTYVDFLNEVRVHHACKLLRNQDMTVAEISELCGFHNLSNFHRQFKKIKGFTPATLKSMS